MSDVNMQNEGVGNEPEPEPEPESDSDSDSVADKDEKNNFTPKPLPPPDSEGWIHIVEDGGIKKKILVEGNGDTPKPDSDVFCHYVGTLVSNGEKFDSSRDRNSPFNFPIGKKRVIRGWDIGIATMKKGEKSILRCRYDYAYGKDGQGKIPPNSDLDFEVELLDWSNWKRVQTKDDFKKQIIIEGEGQDYDNPQEDAKCDITFILKLNDKDGPTIAQQENFEFVLDDDEQWPKGFYDAIKDMKKKSQVEFKIASQYMWGEKGFDKLNVPPNTNIYANITLNAYQNPKERYEMSAKEKFEEAQKFKQQGNDLFKQEQYTRAIKKYKKGLDLMTDLNDNDNNDLKEYENEIKELKISCNNNLAMSYIKTKEYNEAIAKCNEVIKIDKNNIKAYMRCGQALMSEGNYEEAKNNFKNALTLNPNPQETQYINSYLKQLNQKIKDYQDKQKKLYSKMFK